MASEREAGECPPLAATAGVMVVFVEAWSCDDPVLVERRCRAGTRVLDPRDGAAPPGADSQEVTAQDLRLRLGQARWTGAPPPLSARWPTEVGHGGLPWAGLRRCGWSRRAKGWTLCSLRVGIPELGSCGPCGLLGR